MHNRFNIFTRSLISCEYLLNSVDLTLNYQFNNKTNTFERKYCFFLCPKWRVKSVRRNLIAGDWQYAVYLPKVNRWGHSWSEMKLRQTWVSRNELSDIVIHVGLWCCQVGICCWVMAQVIIIHMMLLQMSHTFVIGQNIKHEDMSQFQKIVLNRALLYF